jgi:hypothetical protein
VTGLSTSTCALIFLVLWIFLWEGSAAAARERHILRGEEITVLYDQGLDGLAEYIRGIYPEASSDIRKALGWSVPSKPLVVLVANQQRFKAMSGSELFSAFAVPRRNTVVIHCSPQNTQMVLLGEILKHELCHLALHHHIPSARLPKWLDEGICQWVSGSLGEIMAGSSAVQPTGLSNRHIPLRRLEHRFPTDKSLLLLAYQQSRSFVEYMVKEYGRQSLLKILAKLKKGEPIESAVAAAAGKSLESLEKEWLKERRGKWVWLVWVTQYFYHILFFLGGVLVVGVAVRRTMGKGRFHDMDDDEETPDEN